MIITAIFSHLTADAHRDHGPRDRAIIGRLAMELPDGGSSDSRSRSDGHDPFHLDDAWTHLERPISIRSRSPSNGQDDSRRNSTIAEELHDRGSIEPRSRRNRATIVDVASRNHLHDHQTTPSGKSRSLSWPDRGSILPDRGAIVARSWAFSKRKSSLFAADLKPQSHAIETASTSLENRPHERVNCP